MAPRLVFGESGTYNVGFYNRRIRPGKRLGNPGYKQILNLRCFSLHRRPYQYLVGRFERLYFRFLPEHGCQLAADLDGIELPRALDDELHPTLEVDPKLEASREQCPDAYEEQDR